MPGTRGFANSCRREDRGCGAVVFGGSGARAGGAAVVGDGERGWWARAVHDPTRGFGAVCGGWRRYRGGWSVAVARDGCGVVGRASVTAARVSVAASALCARDRGERFAGGSAWLRGNETARARFAVSIEVRERRERAAGGAPTARC